MAKFVTRKQIAKENNRRQKLAPKRLIVKLHRIPEYVLKKYVASASNGLVKCARYSNPRTLRPRKHTPVVKIEKKSVKKNRVINNVTKISRSQTATYQNTSLFQLGALVFAKVKGYRTWPATIERIMYGQKNGKEVVKKYTVRFFATGDSANVEIDDMHIYCSVTNECFGIDNGSHSKLMTSFRHAMLLIEEALAN